MDTAIVAIAVVAFCAWLVSFASGVMMLKFRDRARSIAWFAFHGIAFFTGEGFTDDAKPWRSRFLIAAALFLACCIAGVALGAAQSVSAA